MQLYSLVQDAFMKLFSRHILLSRFSDFDIIFVVFFLMFELEFVRFRVTAS